MKKKLLTLLFLIAFLMLSTTKALAECKNTCVNINQCPLKDCDSCLYCTSGYPVVTGYEDPTENIGDKITNPVLPKNLSVLQGVPFLNRFAQTGISLGFVLGSLIFFFMLITGAIKYITAGGDKGRLESGQKQITHALVGLVILFCVFAIIQLVETVFGISITKLTLPTL